MKNLIYIIENWTDFTRWVLEIVLLVFIWSRNDWSIALFATLITFAIEFIVISLNLIIDHLKK